MIGLIHRTLCDYIRSVTGEEGLEAVFTAAGLEPTQFRLDRAYPDDIVERLIAAACELSGMTEQEAMEGYARSFLVSAQEIFPAFFTMASDSQDLIRKQASIHALIAAGQSDRAAAAAASDKFSILEDAKGRLVVAYKSDLQMCGLYRALACATAEHWGDQMTIRTTACRKKGASRCTFALEWPEGAETSATAAVRTAT